MIRQHINPCFHETAPKRNFLDFDFDLVDPNCSSCLDIRNKPSDFIMPSFKFMNFHDVRAINFKNVGFSDAHIVMLCDYLKAEAEPSLYSIVLDENPFSDLSLYQLTEALKDNSKVAHLSIKDCPNLTDEGLTHLLEIVMDNNMIIFQIDVEDFKYDHEITDRLKEYSALNYDIQQKLIPKKRYFT